MEPSKLLELDLLADELEIGRLKATGVLIPAESFDMMGRKDSKETDYKNGENMER